MEDLLELLGSNEWEEFEGNSCTFYMPSEEAIEELRKKEKAYWEKMFGTGAV